MSYKSHKGFTLIEVLVGSALMLIIFIGIFGAFRLGMKMIGLSKNKTTATAIANQKLELIRNLPYDSVGISGGYPDGVLQAVTSTIRNNTQFNIQTKVDYVVDSSDGVGEPEDSCPNDYKRAQITVAWSGQFGGSLSMVSNIVPKNIVEECAVVGGVLSVSVFDAFGVMIDSPLIEIKDPVSGNVITSASPVSGGHLFSLPAATYRIVISKAGYSREQTYGSGEMYQGHEIITPENPNPIVIEGRLVEKSFSIDKLSTFLVETLSPWGADDFSDSFLDSSQISEISNLVVSSSLITFITPIAEPGGHVTSAAIVPDSLVAWDKFSWNDEEPENTDIKYHVLYFFEDNWTLVPDSDLAGNDAGFDVSPLDLSGLDKTVYPQLKIKANFLSLNLDISPNLFDWQVTWQTSIATPIPNAPFNLAGQKVVGTDAAEKSIYKYSSDLFTDATGKKTVAGVEWDLYTFLVEPASGLDLTNISPSPQPVSLIPDASQTVKMYLEAENSLLLTVQNIETLAPVFAASVRLRHVGSGYDVTQYTNELGQTFFVPLEAAVYSLEVNSPSYQGIVTTASVSGDAVKIVKLQQIE